ncbi:hypothetical protein AGMMS50239_27950 [Bacteroidia bacterium]|nr:hypothetical protein AGMMS50239_27950 [Bacteroidia bacterium]
MTKIYFTADTHFFHANIIKHCPDRPYPETDGGIDDFNVKTGDLRVDVGIDGMLARE